MDKKKALAMHDAAENGAASVNGMDISPAQAIMMAAKAQDEHFAKGGEERISLAGTPQNPLNAVDLPDDLKQKIREKFVELQRKHPHMKRNRLMRKAGEAYKVKFIIE